jgi:hypothetical protein
MFDRDRRPADAARDRTVGRRAAPPAPSVEAMLALQRGAGNRAIVQRLVYDSYQGDLKIPASYASQTIAWDGEKVPAKPEPADKKSLFEHSKNQNFKSALETGLGLGYLNTVTPVKPDTPFIRDLVDQALNDPNDPAKQTRYTDTTNEVNAVLNAATRLMTLEGATEFKNKSEVTAVTRPVLRPDDFLPETPDLPAAGKNLLTEKIPNHPEKSAYITYACVLFALIKDGGAAKFKEFTGKDLPKNIYVAVQALHDHYMTRNPPVHYDDGAAHVPLMSAWGYSLLWAGETTWEGVANEVSLAPGDYLFFITGHTVKVTVLSQVTKGTAIANAKTVFKPDSDEKNYTKDKEWKQKVTGIWKK